MFNVFARGAFILSSVTVSVTCDRVMISRWWTGMLTAGDSCFITRKRVASFSQHTFCAFEWFATIPEVIILKKYLQDINLNFFIIRSCFLSLIVLLVGHF